MERNCCDYSIADDLEGIGLPEVIQTFLMLGETVRLNLPRFKAKLLMYTVGNRAQAQLVPHVAGIV